MLEEAKAVTELETSLSEDIDEIKMTWKICLKLLFFFIYSE
jgi:hypothetical protein